MTPLVGDQLIGERDFLYNLVLVPLFLIRSTLSLPAQRRSGIPFVVERECILGRPVLDLVKRFI